MESNHLTVGVLGAGTMGQGIAQVCAQSGHGVFLYDIDRGLCEKALASISANLDRLVERSKLQRDEAVAIMKRINTRDSLDAMGTDLIIEAVVEKLDVKCKIFQELVHHTPKTSILVSNTSSLSITAIAEKLDEPDRFAGLHFFNPATVMPLVEIVAGEKTDTRTIEFLKQFCLSISKRYVVAQDSPGFIVNRVARPYYVEGLKVMDDGVANAAGIDKLMRSSRFRMGPFELMDLIGLDINLSVTKSLYEAYNRAPRFKPSDIQQQKVNEGALGRKTGKGFYDYQ